MLKSFYCIWHLDAAGVTCAFSFIFFLHLTAYFTQKYFLFVLQPVTRILKCTSLKAKSPLSKLCHLSVTHLLSQTTWISEKAFAARPAKCNSFICFDKPHNSFLTRAALGFWAPDCLEVTPWPVSRWAALSKSWSSQEQGCVVWENTLYPRCSTVSKSWVCTDFIHSEIVQDFHQGLYKRKVLKRWAGAIVSSLLYPNAGIHRTTKIHYCSTYWM